mgnify:FL=1
MYTIESFDTVTGNLTFRINNQNSDTLILNVKKDKRPNFSDYRRVPDNVYLEEDTNDIVLLELPQFRAVFPPSVYQDIDDKSIRFLKASQYEYDKWSAKEFPDSDNAKVFNLINGLIR